MASDSSIAWVNGAVGPYCAQAVFNSFTFKQERLTSADSITLKIDLLYNWKWKMKSLNTISSLGSLFEGHL